MKIVSVDGKKYKQLYDKLFPYSWQDWKIENYCAFSTKDFGLPKHEHFRKCIEIQFPDKFIKNGKPTWNYWMERMFYAFEGAKKEVCCILSGRSTGKTTMASIWALNKYWNDPMNNGIIVATTTEGEAYSRIYGEIRDLYVDAIERGLVQGREMKGKPFTGFLWDSKKKMKNGIVLRPLKNKNADSAFKGFHPKGKKIVIFDETDELDWSIVTAIPNLLSKEDATVVALANASNYDNPFSEMANPIRLSDGTEINGWGTLDPDKDFAGKGFEDKDYWWYTQRGKAHWLDCYMSPRIKEGREELSYLFNEAAIKEAEKLAGGKDTSDFWRQTRGFPKEFASDQYILTRQLAKESLCFSRGTFDGVHPVIRCASFDPAFASTGDRAILRIFDYGRDNSGMMFIQGYPELVFQIKPDSKTEFNRMLCQEVKAKCIQYGVQPQNFMMDTGHGGIVLLEMLKSYWDSKIQGVSFGSSPSDMVIDSIGTPAKKKFAYAVDEIVFMVRYFLQSRQLRGIDEATIEELIVRKYKNQGKEKIKVQGKEDYKNSLAFQGMKKMSPDLSDNLGIGVHLCRKNFGFIPLLQENNTLNVNYARPDQSGETVILQGWEDEADYMDFDYD